MLDARSCEPKVCAAEIADPRVGGFAESQYDDRRRMPRFDPLDESGPITPAALTDGKVQAAVVFTTTPQILTDSVLESCALELPA
jgi:hypothetical protein